MLFRDGLGLCSGASDGCPANGRKPSVLKNIGGKLVIGQNFIIVGMRAEEVNFNMDTVLSEFFRPKSLAQRQILLRGVKDSTNLIFWHPQLDLWSLSVIFTNCLADSIGATTE